MVVRGGLCSTLAARIENIEKKQNVNGSFVLRRNILYDKININKFIENQNPTISYIIFKCDLRSFDGRSVI